MLSALTVQEETDEKPYFPRAFFLADGASGGMILDYSMYRRAKDDVEQVLNGLQDLFLEKGIPPRQIQVRPGKMAAILEDFCEKADVDLKIVPDLPLIEEFIRGDCGPIVKGRKMKALLIIDMLKDFIEENGGR